MQSVSIQTTCFVSYSSTLDSGRNNDSKREVLTSSYILRVFTSTSNEKGIGSCFICMPILPKDIKHPI